MQSEPSTTIEIPKVPLTALETKRVKEKRANRKRAKAARKLNRKTA